MHHVRRHLRRVALPAALAVLLVTLIPLEVGVAQAASTRWAANCTVNIRSHATTASSRRGRVGPGTVITVSGKVTGGSYAAACGRSVSGRTWLAITAIGGRTVRSLYGVSTVYAAAGLFRELPTRLRRYIYGVDVSQWNGSIDFAKVRASGHEFVLARATAGRLITDSSYARNRAGALKAGLAFTAYHYAHPDLSYDDARKEADHFVDVAQLRPGMLIPALDLEVGSRLGADRLQRWVKTWVQRVYQRLGVKPMIYTTESFWESAMRDTTWFAQNGYRVLWIAHWDTTSPAVPAYNWAGAWWTIWQFSDCGRVSGIPSRCVDLDKFRGSDLSVITW